MVGRGHPPAEVLGPTPAALRLLAEGHAAACAAERRALMAAVRAAVWAEADAFDRLCAPPAAGGADDRADWLEGWSGSEA